MAYMTTDIDSKGKRSPQRVQVLLELKRAVHLQISLWDAIAKLEALVPSDIDPLIWVQATSTDVDGGTEITMADVDDYTEELPDGIHLFGLTCSPS
ncbi:MAG: hypothetical protein DMG80_05045 [Acidobacteria bacterium]|nr:MAG: hypothetical protein DMG80_05045 [Acidobacteriota bacterium]